MDRWWADRATAEKVLDSLSPDDDPQMLIGTAYLALHAIGAHHITEAAGPFGSKSLSKALEAINNDVLIGAVCKAFDDARRQRGYGAWRASREKRKADRAAQAAYQAMRAGKYHPVTALKRTADVYGALSEQPGGIHKSLMADEFAAQSACDASLLRYAAFLADVETSEISKLEQDTFKRGQITITANRDEATGRFATKSSTKAPLSAEDKKRIRAERLAAYMEGARQRKADIPEREAMKEPTRQLEAQAETQEQAEEMATEEATAEEQALLQRRRKKAIARRKAGKAAIAARGRAAASPEGKYGYEMAAARKHLQAQETLQMAAQRARMRQREALAEQQRTEYKPVEAEAQKKLQAQKRAERQKMAEDFKNQYRLFDPDNPEQNRIMAQPKFSQQSGITPDKNWKVPVPLLYKSEDRPFGKEADPREVISFYSGVPVGDLAQSPDNEVIAEQAAARTMGIVRMTMAKGPDADISDVLMDWMAPRKKQVLPRSISGNPEYMANSAVHNVAVVLDTMLTERHDQYLASMHGEKAKKRSVAIHRFNQDTGNDLNLDGLNESLINEYDKVYGTEDSKFPIVEGEWDYANKTPWMKSAYYPDMGSMLVAAYDYVLSGDFEKANTSVSSMHAAMDVAAFMRAAQVLELTRPKKNQANVNPSLVWQPSYTGSLTGITPDDSSSPNHTVNNVEVPKGLGEAMKTLIDAEKFDRNKPGGKRLQQFHYINLDVEKRHKSNPGMDGGLYLNGTLGKRSVPSDSTRAQMIDSQYVIERGATTSRWKPPSEQEASDPHVSYGAVPVVRAPVLPTSLSFRMHQHPNITDPWLLGTVRAGTRNAQSLRTYLLPEGKTKSRRTSEEKLRGYFKSVGDQVQVYLDRSQTQPGNS